MYGKRGKGKRWKKNCSATLEWKTMNLNEMSMDCGTFD